MADPLLLGIDGGGTKTVAWLGARCGSDLKVLGRAAAGSSNFQTVGPAAALQHLGEAIGAAFADAGLTAAPLAAAVIALAGADREENRQAVLNWAREHQLAERVQVVHDAVPLLAAGTPEDWGVALIAGTGSFAYGQDRAGRAARSGGWGFLAGDEGSGYALAVSGLRAAAKAADGRGPETSLVRAFCERFAVRRPLDVIAPLYRLAGDRAAIASLAGLVLKAAEEGDFVAASIFAAAAGDLADLVSSLVARLDLPRSSLPLALSGGLLIGNERLRSAVLARLAEQGIQVNPATVVPEPVAGALALAARYAFAG